MHNTRNWEELIARRYYFSLHCINHKKSVTYTQKRLKQSRYLIYHKRIFKAAIVTMFKDVKENKSVINDKKQINRSYKKKTNGNYKTIEQNSTNKTLLLGYNRILELTKERVWNIKKL